MPQAQRNSTVVVVCVLTVSSIAGCYWQELLVCEHKMIGYKGHNVYV